MSNVSGEVVHEYLVTLSIRTINDSSSTDVDNALSGALDALVCAGEALEDDVARIVAFDVLDVKNVEEG